MSTLVTERMKTHTSDMPFVSTTSENRSSHFISTSKCNCVLQSILLVQREDKASRTLETQAFLLEPFFRNIRRRGSKLKKGTDPLMAEKRGFNYALR